MANVNQSNSVPSTINIPVGFPMEPKPGKISLLFEANEHDLYHKFNAKDYDNGNVLFGSNQPYIYRYPDEEPSSLRQLGGQGLPLGLGVDDVVRMTKYITSGRGLLFLAKQFTLQGYNSFDETNLYNPTEVILTATSNLTGGLLNAPTRHINKSGGLLGGLASLIGVGISRGTPPPSTVAAGSGTGGSGGSGGFLSGLTSNLTGGGSNRETEVLPVQNYGNGTGLLRGKTANKARGILQSKWSVTSNDTTSGGILGYVKNVAKSMFPQVFGSEKQNYKQRADEDAYSWMVTYYNQYTAKNQSVGYVNTGLSFSFMGIDLYNSNPTKATPSITNVKVDSFKQKYYKDKDGKSFIYSKDAVYIKGDEEKSNIKTTFTDNVKKIKTADINDTLKKVLNNIKKSDIYSVDFNNNDTWLLSSGNTSKAGYDRLIDISKTSGDVSSGNGSGTSHKDSVISMYRDNNIATLDSIINGSKNYGLAGNGRPDKINTLTVLSKDKKTAISVVDKNGKLVYNSNGTVKKQPIFSDWVEWKPYEDDLIAFFFYDVVNEKYIPFRATVKGISEANSSLWEELRFLGRADSIYSYSGFTRNLSFSFTVNINSLVELYPTWQRISYLATTVKPSGYTKRKENSNITSRFIIPPMFMVTIGDLYKYQPIIITTVNVNIPDSAIWETKSEESSEDWSYMANIIKSSVSNTRIGQLPREAEISVTCNLLEKERPEVGGNQYGHAPLIDEGDSVNYNIVQGVDYLPPVHKFSENLKTVNKYNF